MKKIIAVMLISVLLLGCFSGCGKEEIPAEQSHTPTQSAQQGSVETVASKPKFAYKANYLPITTHTGDALNYINYFVFADNRLYFSGSYISGTETPTDPETGEAILDEKTGEPVSYDVYEDGLFFMDLTSGSVSLADDIGETEVPEGYMGDSYIQSMFPGVDGTLWILEQTNTYYFDIPEGTEVTESDQWNYYVDGGTFHQLSQFSADGQKLQSVELQLPDDVYPGSAVADQAGNIYCTDWQNIYIFDSTGALTATLRVDNGFNELVKFSENQIGITTWTQDYSKLVFRPIDPEAKAFGEDISLVQNAYQIQPGSGEYLYYYSDSDSIYGVKEGMETGEKLMSWLDCDVDSNSINNEFQILGDGRIVAIEQNYSESSTGSNLIILEQVDPSTIPQRQELVLGCISLDYELRPMIVAFNRAQSDVRIVVRDYSEYLNDGTYEDAIQKINTEILSGSAPDLLCASGLPLKQYAAKGILADLWPLIDGDPDISREALMRHLFDVMSIDGKLYQVTNSFSIQTAACRTAFTGDKTSWTLDDVLQAMNNLQPGAGIFGETDTKTGMLNQCLGFNLDSFMDWNTGTASFDSETFIEILKFCNSFPAEFNYENYDWETAESEYSRLMNGKQLMTTCYISSFGDLQVQYALHNADVNFIGFPSENGTGSCFQPGSTISITTSCKNTEAAWRFVRELLLAENQTQEHMWNFPTNKAAFDTLVKEQMTPQYWTNPETGEQEEISTMGYGIGNDFNVEIYAMKQDEYDAFMRLYENCKTVYSYDQSVMTIIQEECEPFFAGQKTAEEVASIVQNRLSLYMAERT